MSRYIATRAIRGANALVNEAEVMLHKALREKGAETPVAFPNTAYHLPLIFGMTGMAVQKLGDLPPVLKHARELLHPVPAPHHWTPYLGETLDSGMATLLPRQVPGLSGLCNRYLVHLPGVRHLALTQLFQGAAHGLDGDIEQRQWIDGNLVANRFELRRRQQRRFAELDQIDHLGAGHFVAIAAHFLFAQWCFQKGDVGADVDLAAVRAQLAAFST